MVASGIPYVFKIVVFPAGAKALLHGYGSLVGTGFFSEKHPLELIHTGVGEEQGRVRLGNQGRARHRLMAVFLEITDKGPSQISRTILHKQIPR
jgi:hypothetical protein